MKNKKIVEMNTEAKDANVVLETRKKSRLTIAVRIYTVFTAVVVLVAASFSVYVYSWFLNKKAVGAYGAVSAPDSLFIAAGHSDMEEFVFENIRYLYFRGIDASGDSDREYDYLFCVYGKAIKSYNLQLAFTTNNQFEYEILYADEIDVDGDQVPQEYDISYEMHTVENKTYYYTIRRDSNNVEIPVKGEFKNADFDQSNPGDSLRLAKDANDNDRYYDLTYEDYTGVNSYGVPLYWQTTEAIDAHENELEDFGKPFAHYYILRIHTKGGRVNDRETDVICISAKSGS